MLWPAGITFTLRFAVFCQTGITFTLPFCGLLAILDHFYSASRSALAIWAHSHIADCSVLTIWDHLTSRFVVFWQSRIFFTLRFAVLWQSRLTAWCRSGLSFGCLHAIPAAPLFSVLPRPHECPKNKVWSPPKLNVAVQTNKIWPSKQTKSSHQQN